MRHLTFGPVRTSYKIAILVNQIRENDIKNAYIIPHMLNEDEIIVISLHQSETKKKTSAAEQKAYIQQELAPVLNDLGVEFLIVADGDYFKTLTKKPTVDKVLGYMLDTEYGPWKVTYVPNYQTIFYDPIKVKQRIDMGISALQNWMLGTYVNPGIDIIKFAEYPSTVDEIAAWLDRLIEMDCDLTIDIEAFSLKHYDAGIGTIAFAWSKTEGVCFPVDILDDPTHSREVRELLQEFFVNFKRKAIYHRVWYDVYVLIYQLFMKNILDNEGMLRGLEIMLRNWDCTQLISYLATNSCAGNKLGLKYQAQEYTGDYAQENITDIRKIPLPQLLQYNLVDGLATWFVHGKNYPKMVKDQQLDIYQTLFKPAIVDIIQMQLTGMPMDMAQVGKVKAALQGICDDAVARMTSSQIVQKYSYHRLETHTNKKNAEWVNKRMTITEMAQLATENENVRKEVEFNPNSGPQLIELLYEKLGLPVLDQTDTKLPATSNKTLEKLVNHTSDPAIKDLLGALIDYKAVDKLLTSFMPSFENAQLGPDGWYWLFGYFNLGGTISGRLSSSDPNLQNLPANVMMKLSAALLERFKDVLAPFVGKKDGKLSLGKLIKSCFMAPPGWHYCGIDFASLEDRISALTTKDPNKLKVYTDGYDGHCLRAYAYFGDKMPDIDPTSVESINSIADKYPKDRQVSKNPTFALTYQGDYGTLMRNYGFSEELSRKLEASYAELYAISIAWVNAKLDQASKDGFITAAFGLKVRTPLLHQVVRGTSRTPHQAEAEGRSAGNALGQSWCLLNSRAGSEFMGKVRTSEFRNDIKPCAQIHDAQYYLVRDNIDAVHFANENVVKACQWQNDPEIWHDEVKLGGEFSIFHPNWAYEATIPNGAEPAEIYEVFEKHVQKLAA